eukprot:m.1274362 g.1274362  ORF g.1274362 m.1274362 type:complete len:310 (+) comp24758_c0_seq6:202-1131(+)
MCVVGAFIDSAEKEYVDMMKNLQFRMVNLDFNTHTYARQICATQNAPIRRDRLRQITREMSSLSSSLPLSYSSSIFIRVDESRPDVLKALIIGPEGTPYANGCFEFDIFLPPEYPQRPPLVTFLTTSHGTVRFNPNLYDNGKVCLSLLGTWDGPGWDAKSSTVLQVLLSIQSLILVEEPYFNEPGFESHPQARRQCDEYNQSIRYQTMRVAMMEAMANTTTPFYSVIETHFRLKKELLLGQCARWVEQVLPPKTSAHKHGPKKAHPFWAHHSGSHHHLSAVTKTQTSSIADSVCEMLGCLEAPKSITLD